jgi:hypothetical protein
MAFLREFWGFLKTRKKLWLLPIILVMGVLAVLVIVGGNPAIAPFVYTLF